MTTMPILHDDLEEGQRIGHGTLIGEAELRDKGFLQWCCLCDCGKYYYARKSALRRGTPKSCGCQWTLEHRKANGSKMGKKGLANYTHGLSTTREHQSWRNMLYRCYNPKAINYNKYGGAGITVCKPWRDHFITFYGDMGRCPPKFSLDRIENSKGYEPGNCRWADRTTQNRNRECVKVNLTLAGQILWYLPAYLKKEISMQEVAKRHGVKWHIVADIFSRRNWKDATPLPPTT